MTNISQIGLKPPASIGWVCPKDHQMGPIFSGGSNNADFSYNSALLGVGNIKTPVSPFPPPGFLHV